MECFIQNDQKIRVVGGTALSCSYSKYVHVLVNKVMVLNKCFQSIFFGPEQRYFFKCLSCNIYVFQLRSWVIIFNIIILAGEGYCVYCLLSLELFKAYSVNTRLVRGQAFVNLHYSKYLYCVVVMIIFKLQYISIIQKLHGRNYYDSR